MTHSIPREIERKFLVRDERLPGDWRTFPSTRIAQGYLVVNEAEAREVRVRKRGEVFTLTAKTGGGVERDEAEVELTSEQFEALWPLTEGWRLEKTRYEIPVGDFTAELDAYRGRHEGLRVVEVEFPDGEAAEAFSPPEWFGEEVSGEDAYRNQRLARGG